MGKIGIVLSSAISKIDKVEKSELVVGEILLSLYIGEEEYNSRTITQAELFERMRTEHEFPTTAQPSPGHITEVIDQALTKCEKLIVILPHRSLSGIYQNVVGVVKEHESKDNIFVIDTNSIAVSELAVAAKAIDLIESGCEFVEVCNMLTEYNNRIFTLAYPGSTKHLRKSGRITNGQALILGALHIRVQIKCAGEAPFSDAKGRGEKFVLRDIEQELSKVNVEHIYYSSLEESPKLRAAIFAMFERNGYEYTATPDADAIPSVHFGENTLGFSVVCK